MGTTLLKNTTSKGWAIYDKQYIDADNAKNKHVVEGTFDANGGFIPNSQHNTLCGRQLKKGVRKCSNPSRSRSEMRSTLSEQQNHGSEICGGCVSCFYADPKQP